LTDIILNLARVKVKNDVFQGKLEYAIGDVLCYIKFIALPDSNFMIDKLFIWI